MVKKKGKGRSVRNNTNTTAEPENFVKAPHSFVIHKGLPGKNVVDLTKDFRKVMEPFTATSLKERKSNTIKDFVSIAGFLHVSHLCIFSRTELGLYFKICKLPRGPSLTFKVTNFSLARDVVSSLKKQQVIESAFKHSPLTVLNSFSGEGMHLKLMATTFQNMFPTLNLTTVDLNDVRRCILLDYNPATNQINFRHYVIKVVPVGVSKGIKKVVQGKVPNLSRCNDISEFLTQAGMLSESEFEDDGTSHVTVPQKLVSRGNVEEGKSAIRLTELGPRLTLQLIKIEDGLLDGAVLYHDYIEKTEEEKVEIEKKRAAKRKLKEKRKKVQQLNKKRKEEDKEILKQKSLEGMKKAGTEVPEKVPEDDDAEYYRQEVGEEPDKDLFDKPRTGQKWPAGKHFNRFNNKRPQFEGLKNRDEHNKFDRFKGNKFDRFKGNKFDRFKGNKFDRFKGDNNKFSSNRFKGKGRDKTNSHMRDQRPIGKMHNKKR